MACPKRSGGSDSGNRHYLSAHARRARTGPRGDAAPGSRVLPDLGAPEFEHAAAHPVLRLLPKTLYLPAHATRERADLTATVAALAREYESGGRGASLVVSRLLEVLFVQAVRAWADQQPQGGAGWIGALRDPTLARTLALLHEDLARPWDVAALARVAGTSRATLGRRFSTEVGEAPLAYLTRARMLRAARSLESTDEGLAAIARDVGYTSEFAFSRAFRREFGVPPGEYRKRQAESPRESRLA
jgi:transcriptional regulator GlxA family with amidase domain